MLLRQSHPQASVLVFGDNTSGRGALLVPYATEDDLAYYYVPLK